MADIDAEINRLELEIEKHNKLIVDAGNEEQLSRQRVEADRKGFEGVNMEIQRCRQGILILLRKARLAKFCLPFFWCQTPCESYDTMHIRYVYGHRI